MAARVQQQLEDMVPELHKLKELQLFTEEEVRDIVKRRRKFEYMVISTDPVYALNSYREYIKYEMKLDRVLQRRLRQSKNEATRASGSDRVVSEGGSVPLRVTVRRRIHRIFKRCLNRFVTAIDLWKEYCAFCYRIKAYGVMNRVIMSVLAKNPACEDLWRLATKYTLTLQGSLAAKNVVQMALRTNPKSLEMFILLLELEVQSTHSLFQYSQEKEEANEAVEEQLEISCKTWTIIMKHALGALEAPNVFRMLFFGATICARIRQMTDFCRTLKDYDDFAATVFEEMFSRREQHPLLGLYIWQHRLLESLLLHGGKEGDDLVMEVQEESPTPDSIYADMLEDCRRHREMMPPMAQFIRSVISEPAEDKAQPVSDDKPVWVIDVGEGAAEEDKGALEVVGEEAETDDDMETYCGGIECLKDICFLRSSSKSFDMVNESCRYTKGILDLKSLLALRKVYQGFLSEKVAETVAAIKGASAGNDTKRVAEVYMSGPNELLRFLMLQVAVPGALVYSISGYCLALELAKRCDDGGAFVELVSQSILHSIFNPELSETTRTNCLLMAVKSEHISITMKLEVTRKTALSLTQQQLQSAASYAVKNIADDMRMIELVLSLMAASSPVLTEDFVDGKDVVHRIFTAIQKRIPGITEMLKKYKTNKLGLRNFGVLSVVVSLWQVRYSMEKLNSEIRQTECSEFLNDNCEVVSQVYATAAREIIDLCETAVGAIASVNITDATKKAQFSNRCWNLYLRCAKDLEQLDLRVPIFNLNTFNVSSDAVAARAVAQLGKNFVFNNE